MQRTVSDDDVADARHPPDSLCQSAGPAALVTLTPSLVAFTHLLMFAASIGYSVARRSDPSAVLQQLQSACAVAVGGPAAWPSERFRLTAAVVMLDSRCSWGCEWMRGHTATAVPIVHSTALTAGSMIVLLASGWLRRVDSWLKKNVRTLRSE